MLAYYVQRQLLFGKVDLKNESISSLFATSKNWNSSRSFLLHETTRFGFRGAGGQVRISGILLSFDVGVLQLSSSSCSGNLFCTMIGTLPWAEEASSEGRTAILIGEIRTFGISRRICRSVDIFDCRRITPRMYVFCLDGEKND